MSCRACENERKVGMPAGVGVHTCREYICTCPNCGWKTANTTSRKCNACGYIGDWIQPGEETTYAQRQGKCPCDHCLRGSDEECYMTKKEA